MLVCWYGREGGTRVTALVSGAGIATTTSSSGRGGGDGRAIYGLIHATDWAPTILEAAGAAPYRWQYFRSLGRRGTATISDSDVVDGVSVWPMLQGKNLTSPRTFVLHNIHEVAGSAALRIGDWKVLLGQKEQACGGWYSGVTGLVREAAAVVGASVACGIEDKDAISCDPAVAPCLFRLSCSEQDNLQPSSTSQTCQADPCEKRNLAQEEPQVLAKMLGRLKALNASAVPCLNNPARGTDAWWWPDASPVLHGGAWVPWFRDGADGNASATPPTRPPLD